MSGDPIAYLADIFGIPFSPQRAAAWRDSLKSIPEGELWTAIRAVCRTAKKLPTPAEVMAAFLKAKRSHDANHPDNKSWAIVCSYCAEKYYASKNSWTHNCDPLRLQHYSTPQGRNERQARGLAICTGEVVEVKKPRHQTKDDFEEGSF